MCKHLNYEKEHVEDVMPDEDGFICMDCNKLFIKNIEGEITWEE